VLLTHILLQGSESQSWSAYRTAVTLSDHSRVFVMQLVHQGVRTLPFGLGETPGFHSVVSS